MARLKMDHKKEKDRNMSLEINRIVHEPARLKILSYLTLVESADFTFLVSRIGLTMGNLSAHISKLEGAGYINVIKEFKDKRPRTLISISESGREAFETYRQDILSLLGR
jgi:DNA-binding MarR family transcriptional regulator